MLTFVGVPWRTMVSIIEKRRGSLVQLLFAKDTRCSCPKRVISSVPMVFNNNRFSACLHKKHETIHHFQTRNVSQPGLLRLNVYFNFSS